VAQQAMEERGYQVHPAQLRWAMSSLNAAGVPVMGYQPGAGGVYIIIVQQPIGSPSLDWQTMTSRQQRESNNLRRLLIALCIVAIVGGCAYLGYTILAANGVRMPWQALPNGEPVVTQTEPQGWTLPNPFQPAQDAAQATQDAADAVAGAVALLFRVALIALALFGAWLARGILGPMARGAARLAQDMAGRMRR
jgi:hypothetical protein